MEASKSEDSAESTKCLRCCPMHSGTETILLLLTSHQIINMLATKCLLF